MSKFSHPNIVHFIGACFDTHPRYIILELLAGGDLKNFLRDSRPKAVSIFILILVSALHLQFTDYYTRIICRTNRQR